jgi:hypothetical protein
MFQALFCSSSSGGTVCTAIGVFLCVLCPLAASWYNTHKNIPFAVYTVPPDDEQKNCSKHVEAINWNKLKVNCASYWSYYTDILRCTVNKTLSLKWCYNFHRILHCQVLWMSV